LLRSWDSARIEQVYYKQEKLDTTGTKLSAEIKIDAYHDLHAVLILKVNGKEMSRTPVALKKGIGSVLKFGNLYPYLPLVLFS